MKRESKLTSREEQELTEKVSQQHAAQEFSSVEEMLRHDALHTPVPPEVGFRLRKSIGEVPVNKPGWLKKIFGS
jgi:hypothetical protein